MDPLIRVPIHGRWVDNLGNCTEEVWLSKLLVTPRTATQKNCSYQGQQEPLHYWALKRLHLVTSSQHGLALRMLINLKQSLPLTLCQYILHNLLWPLWILIRPFMIPSFSAWNLNWSYSGLVKKFIFLSFYLLESSYQCAWFTSLSLAAFGYGLSPADFPTKIVLNSIHVSSSFLMLFHSSQRHVFLLLKYLIGRSVRQRGQGLLTP